MRSEAGMARQGKLKRHDGSKANAMAASSRVFTTSGNHDPWANAGGVLRFPETPSVRVSYNYIMEEIFWLKYLYSPYTL